MNEWERERESCWLSVVVVFSPQSLLLLCLELRAEFLSWCLSRERLFSFFLFFFFEEKSNLASRNEVVRKDMKA